jgi:glucuronate isomerase
MHTGLINENMLFPADPEVRRFAESLYEGVSGLPIISPHGHVDPAWFADNESFEDPTELLLVHDHYLYRMMYSQGVSLQALGVVNRRGEPVAGPRDAWREFAAHYYLFRGTPSSLWLNLVFARLFGLSEVLSPATADHYFDTISGALATDEFRPRALFDSFNIELLATTESPLDDLEHHRVIRQSGWDGRVITTYRPDNVVDPENPDFAEGLVTLGELAGQDTSSWQGYLNAHRVRREFFKAAGATATDHGHPTAQTADQSDAQCEKLYEAVRIGRFSAEEAELFRAQMLTEMAKMSIDDGLVMQIHAGAKRDHNHTIFAEYGKDKGADIPLQVDFVNGLKPLLDRFGNSKELSIILFTLDETNYGRELAPLAGHYPILKIGPAWWFFDSPDGMRRFREFTTETAGFYNTVGFNDDARSFLSIPARHEVARRIDCGYLASLVSEHRLDMEDAREVAVDLAYNLPRKSYRLDQTNALVEGESE